MFWDHTCFSTSLFVRKEIQEEEKRIHIREVATRLNCSSRWKLLRPGFSGMCRNYGRCHDDPMQSYAGKLLETDHCRSCGGGEDNDDGTDSIIKKCLLSVPRSRTDFRKTRAHASLPSRLFN